MEFVINSKKYDFLTPYIIAEIGVNHGGDFDLAKKLIKQAADGGAHGAKFQTYKAEKIASKDHSKSYWDLNEESSTSQYQLFKKYDLFDEKEYKALSEYARSLNVDFLSTPFDLDAVDMLDSMIPFFKIASADITNIPLLRKIALKHKPVVLSTGASTKEEIDLALKTLKESGASEITLLHCVLNYPTPKEHANLGGIQWLINEYGDNYSIGYSDHVKPESDGQMPALIMAVNMGAVVIEKHFTHDKSLPGNDHYHAMNEEDLKFFTKQLDSFKTMYGDVSKNISNEESARTNARRRICLKDEVYENDILTEENLIALRADRGIEIASWDKVLGKKVNKNIEKSAPLEWEFLKPN